MAVLPSHLTTLKELLVKNGFIKDSAKPRYTKNDRGEWQLDDQGKVDAGDADVEVGEEVNVGSLHAYNTYLETGFPKPKRRFRLVLESPSATIEEPYFWLLEHARQDWSHPFVEKITDTYAGSEQSSFWGAAQSRIGIQQDRASQYLKGISEMIKQLFQLVRELRILDEKLEPRKKWNHAAKDRSNESPAADMALKAEYTDLVENRGGQLQPGSIYHLSQSVGYTVLPDMFFNTRCYDLDKVDADVEKQWKSYNTNVKNVLKRKMYAFINWKVKTDAELQTRRDFTLRYLRQHWNTIKMYMNWVKPYLRNVQRMQMSPSELESPDLIGAFETSTIEIEILAYKQAKSGAHSCVLFTFKYRTKPDMSFQKDQYAHKGPIHVGRVEVGIRAYGWSAAQIEAYKKFRHQEDMQLLGMVDESIKNAMDALGEELEKYLSEAGEKEFEDKKKAKEAASKKEEAAAARASENMLDPFISIFKGFADIGGAFAGHSHGGGPKPSGKKEAAKKDLDSAASNAAFLAFQIFKNYKKGHGLLAW